MPTVILLDASLSMCRLSSRQTSIKGSLSSSQHDNIDFRQLANVGIGTLLDYIAQNSQLEHTSLIAFSTLYEIRNQFTRNHEIVKDGIYNLELYDRSHIVNALKGASSMKLDEWSQTGEINIILVTDGYYNARRPSISKRNDFYDIPLEDLEGHFDFPCKIQVVCLCSPHDPIITQNLSFFKKLVATVDRNCEDCPVIIGPTKNTTPSAIWLPDSTAPDASVQSVETLFKCIAEIHYKPYHSVLAFGRLSSMVLLSPKPSECLVETMRNKYGESSPVGSQEKKGSNRSPNSASNKVHIFTLNEEISICGFMLSSEIASPAVTSRHLIIPISNSKFNETSKAQQILSQDPNAYCKSIQTCPIGTTMVTNKSDSSFNRGTSDSNKAGVKSNSNTADSVMELDPTKQPSFCALLHSCLKQENTVAICIVGRNSDSNENWFGILHPHVDARKRSNLMLSLLLPGSNPVLWLPSFNTLGSLSLAPEGKSAVGEKGSSNKLAKSYSSNNVIWLDPESVQADVQRVVRLVKRGIDKAPNFYKELNRIRRAAISYGFYDVLSGLASILERERCILIPDQSKPGYPEIIQQIDNVLKSLHADLTEESYDTRLIPSV